MTVTRQEARPLTETDLAQDNDGDNALQGTEPSLRCTTAPRRAERQVRSPTTSVEKASEKMTKDVRARRDWARARAS